MLPYMDVLTGWMYKFPLCGTTYWLVSPAAPSSNPGAMGTVSPLLLVSCRVDGMYPAGSIWSRMPCSFGALAQVAGRLATTPTCMAPGTGIFCPGDTSCQVIPPSRDRKYSNPSAEGALNNQDAAVGVIAMALLNQSDCSWNSTW